MSQRLCLLALALTPVVTLAQTAKPADTTQTGTNAHKANSATTRASVSSPGLPASVAAAMKAVSGDRIREHIRFLSHDLLEGRGTGARGGDIAGQYIATTLHANSARLAWVTPLGSPVEPDV